MVSFIAVRNLLIFFFLTFLRNWTFLFVRWWNGMASQQVWEVISGQFWILTIQFLMLDLYFLLSSPHYD